MSVLAKYWQNLTRNTADEPKVVVEERAAETPLPAETLDVEIAPNDPLLNYLLSTSGPVDVDDLLLDSPGLRGLKEAGVKLTVPLVSQGELTGLLNLGPRLSEQAYSTDDRRLLNDLATQAAPAVRVAQLVRQQQAEALERERIEQEMRVASIIQQTLLPQELPQLAGWGVAAYWQPARAVGGDFYDFIPFPDGRMGIIIGDVTDKGVPAAIVMATTRSVLRAVTERLVSPGEVLEHVNNLLCPDIPQNMFVTCLYAVLDPRSGELQYANAGHCLPVLLDGEETRELRATGMPLGLMPDMTYEEKKTVLQPGESVLFYSDGLIEAHNSEGEMFGTSRLRELIIGQPGGERMIEFLLSELTEFAGAGWEQEDDATFVTLQRFGQDLERRGPPKHSNSRFSANSWRTLAEFSVPSAPGNERQAMEQVADAVHPLDLSEPRLEKLKTAVAEATMNGMEHGNQYQHDLPVSVQVLASDEALAVRVTDQGRAEDEPSGNVEIPDLDAKLAGAQSPRGWGLFLIQNMVDEMKITQDETQHTVELILELKGDEDAGENV